jgi:splicing factor 1
MTMTVRIRMEEVQHNIQTNKLDLGEPSLRRSPEPVPVYDQRGVRVNTKEKVAQDKQQWERQGLILAAAQINPQLVAPHDFRMQEQKLQMRINIPFKEYPDYNFIGLIIGPRGMTQKQMEKDTGCKIAIRGKGSVKDGKQSSGGSDEPLHVLITAPNLESLKKAEQIVRKLVTPVEEDVRNPFAWSLVYDSHSPFFRSFLLKRNEHKKAQLRKLAEINGTLRAGSEFGGPDRRAGPAGAGSSNSAVCRNCGSGAHPSYDCPEHGNVIGVRNMPVREFFYQEYANFCREVGEAPPAPLAQLGTVDAEAAMSAFYNDLEGVH